MTTSSPFLTILSTFKSRLSKLTHVLVASAYGFWRDDCYAKASTLTFYTLQAIVPILAAGLGIAKGFGFDAYLSSLITQLFQEQHEAVGYALEIANSMLAHIKGGPIAGIGVLFLFWTNINLLGYIETALNDIWKVQIPRDIFQRFKDFLATIIICPLVLVISSSVTVYFETQVDQFHLPFLSFVDGALMWLLRILFPTVLSCLLFALIYFVIPKARIGVWPRILAAILAGIAFQAWQLIYINLQVQVFNYGAVYGTFSILPLFLIWLQVSWLIVLAGAEVAAHMETMLFLELTTRGKTQYVNHKELALLLLYHCFHAYYHHTPPPTDLLLAQKLKLPINATRKVLQVLEHARVIAPVSIEGWEDGYLPIIDPETLTITEICSIIEREFDIQLPVETSHTLTHLKELLEKIDRSAENSEANITLKALFR